MSYNLFGSLLIRFLHVRAGMMIFIGCCLQLKPGQQIPSPSELMGKILIKNKKGPTAPAKPPPKKEQEESPTAEKAGENSHRLHFSDSFKLCALCVMLHTDLNASPTHHSTHSTT